MPTSGRVAVYETPNGLVLLQSHRLQPPAAGEALVRVRRATICRSDIHSWQERRPNPCPGVFGHEIIGSIVALGAGSTHDGRGDPLAPCDRITWREYFARAPDDDTEVLDLPQKSPRVDKRGAIAVDTPPPHHGDFGEYCDVVPRPWILRLPDALNDVEATPSDCGVATLMAATEGAAGKRVLRAAITRSRPLP